jgi:hypothetical protein
VSESRAPNGIVPPAVEEVLDFVEASSGLLRAERLDESLSSGWAIRHAEWTGLLILNAGGWMLMVRDSERNDGVLDLAEIVPWLRTNPTTSP